MIPLINSNNHNPNGNYYIDKKSSEIKDVEEVKKYLKNDAPGNQLFEINKILENRTNDQEGSIMIEFEFKNIIKQSTKNALIKLYGFKPINN